MTDEQRLDAVLAWLRDTPAPATACDEHAAQVAAWGDPALPLDVEVLVEVVDCPACAAALDAHPVLGGELVDLPVPPPVVPAPRRRVPWAVFAVAAAIVLFTWAVTPPAADAPPVPGPTTAGHASYAFVDLAGPHIKGVASYGWVERPVAAEDYRFHAREPDLVALNYTYSPWSWR